jgi:eukaryotic-like serine/threonine-protein kinase
MLGRGDRRGAIQLAALLLCLAASGLLRAHHVRRLADEYFLVAGLLAWWLYSAAFVALLYLAFEPFVRRKWPRMLTGWMRLLRGRSRDALVGRDILVGCLGGVVLVSVRWLAFAVGERRGLAIMPPFEPLPDSLQATRHVVSLVLFLVANSLGLALGGLLLLRLVHSVVRPPWLATVVSLIILTPLCVRPAGDQLGMAVAEAFGVAIVGLLVTYRYGFLASVVLVFVADVLFRVPLATDLSAWYAGRSLFAFAVVAGIAAYGLHSVVSVTRSQVSRIPVSDRLDTSATRSQ